MSVDEDQLCDLLYHVLETEHGGVRGLRGRFGFRAQR